MSDKPPYLPPPPWWLKQHPEYGPMPGEVNTAEPMPSHKWPWISLVLSAYVAIGIPIKTAIEGLAPTDTLASLATVEGLTIAWTVGSYFWLHHVIDQRRRWREQRELEWWLKELPEEVES